MNDFSVDEAAAARIRYIVSLSKCLKPAVILYDSSAAGYSLYERLVTFRKQETRGLDIEAMAQEQFNEIQEQIGKTLTVDACESAAMRPEDIRDVNGIAFVMDSNVADLLSEYCLTFEDSRFVLRSGSDVAHSLLSIMMKRSRPGSTE
jgi:hypothetical protein